MGAAGRFLRIHPGEGRSVGLVVASMLVTSAGLALGESGIEALFLGRSGPDALPAMYVAQGGACIAAMLALTGVLTRFDRRRAFVAMPVLMAVVVLVERALLATDAGWIYPVLWLTVALAVLVQSVFVWGTAGLVTDTRRAKRHFPLFAGGAILGAVVGGLATRPLAGLVGTSNLLLAWVVALGIGAVLSAVVLGVHRPTGARRHERPRRRRPSALREIAEGVVAVRRSPLLVWMAVAAVLFSVLFYVLYLPYVQAATARYPDAEDLAGFFGVFWAAGTGAAFLVSILLTNRLIGRFGAAVLVLALPVLYAGSFGVLLASSSFAILVATRFGIGVWLQGVGSPSWETLVNVVPDGRRDQVRAFLNGGPTQVGTAIAGILTLLGRETMTARHLFVIGLVVAAITIAVAWRIRRSYRGALVAALRSGRPSVFDGGAVGGLPVVLGRDHQALALALDASEDPDPRIRRLAVELLAGADEGRARDRLLERLGDADATVRASAIRALGRSGDLEPLAVERALADEDAEVRRSAIGTLIESPTHLDLVARLGALLDDADPEVASAAGAALLNGPSAREAREALERRLADPDPAVRLAVLRRLERAGADEVPTLVRPRLEDGSAAVRAQALRTLASSHPSAAIAPAIAALESDDGALRDTAFGVLMDLHVRDQAAALRDRAERCRALAVRDRELAASIPTDGGPGDLLRDALVDRGRRHALVALTAVAVVSSDRDAIRTALDSLPGAEGVQLANALETIDASEHRSFARALLPLWETAGPPAPRREEWLQALLQEPDPLIRSCAELVRTVRERGREQGEDMARSRPSMSPMERVLALRRVPLFSGLSPADLQGVAGIADEHAYAHGEVIAGEGELGEELHVVIAGTVAVVRGQTGATRELARRGPGEVVGEMSIITRAPRMASLLADGDVRTLRIGHREFESMIRERPDVSLAVMRQLAERLSAQADDAVPPAG